MIDPRILSGLMALPTGATGAAIPSKSTVREARITHSTNSAILDNACLDAMKPARFTPELQNGLPVEDSTDIAIYW
jgi:outer membrane biosynthesis protein TonB